MNPRTIGIVCAFAATGLGLLYMAAADAPYIYVVVNTLSLAAGLALIGLISRTERRPGSPGGAVLVCGLVLLGTALFGVSVAGATRWISIGGLSLQVSLVLLPAMLIGFARERDLTATVGIVLAAIALALQPDRAMAGVLFAALGVLAIYHRDRWAMIGLVAAGAGFVTALIRPDELPAVPFVDQILYTSFQVHPLIGVAVVGGSLLLLVPAFTGMRADAEKREVYAVFGVTWLGVVVAAALGNYPTPVVGFGGSAILGYALSLAFLPRTAAAAQKVGALALERLH